MSQNTHEDQHLNARLFGLSRPPTPAMQSKVSRTSSVRGLRWEQTVIAKWTPRYKIFKVLKALATLVLQRGRGPKTARLCCLAHVRCRIHEAERRKVSPYLYKSVHQDVSASRSAAPKSGGTKGRTSVAKASKSSSKHFERYCFLCD